MGKSEEGKPVPERAAKVPKPDRQQARAQREADTASAIKPGDSRPGRDRHRRQTVCDMAPEACA